MFKTSYNTSFIEGVLCFHWNPIENMSLPDIQRPYKIWMKYIFSYQSMTENDMINKPFKYETVTSVRW